MNKKAVPTAAAVRELAILTGAVAIIAAAVYFFLVPSHASVSSISGLGIVLANFVPLPLSAITMILNVVLLVIGFLDLRAGVRCQDGLHQHPAPGVYRPVRAALPEPRLPD